MLPSIPAHARRPNGRNCGEAWRHARRRSTLTYDLTYEICRSKQLSLRAGHQTSKISSCSPLPSDRNGLQAIVMITTWHPDPYAHTLIMRAVRPIFSVLRSECLLTRSLPLSGEIPKLYHSYQLSLLTGVSASSHHALSHPRIRLCA